MDYESLGMRIRRARKAAGMTQADLAEKLGISTSFLGHIERGTRKASLDTLVKMANELGVSLDSLAADSLDSQLRDSGISYSRQQKLALREAVKGGKANREELVALGKQVFDEVKASIAPEAQRVITKNLGSFDEYLTKCIESAVLEIKQNEPYITLPESALIEGEAER